MAKPYSGHFPYTERGISDHGPISTGVYYCGVITTEGKLRPYYIGKSSAIHGMRGRLLQHLSESKWWDITHFGFEECTTEDEALRHEENEIKLYKPKYNTQHL